MDMPIIHPLVVLIAGLLLAAGAGGCSYLAMRELKERDGERPDFSLWRLVQNSVLGIGGGAVAMFLTLTLGLVDVAPVLLSACLGGYLNLEFGRLLKESAATIYQRIIALLLRSPPQ